MADAEPADNISSGSYLLGSETVFEFVCQPCDHEGNTVEAEGYCSDCCEYLCAECYRFHGKVAITRHHKQNMPKQPGGVNDVCTERCRSHEDEIVKYFCPTHEELGCTACVTIKHKACAVKYIADICKDFANSEEYKTFQTKMHDMIIKYEHVIKSGTRDLEELQAISTNFDTLIGQKRYCQMFTDMKHAEKKLSEFNDAHISFGNYVTEFKYKDSEEELQSVKGDSDAPWRVVEKPELMVQLIHLTDIEVQLDTDSCSCTISDIACMSKEKLMVVDNENKKIKLCDTINNKVILYLDTEESPWGVTRVGANLAAVTLPDAQKLLLLKCDDTLVIGREINVNGECYGVDSAMEKLFVSFKDPSKVEVLSMSGDVLQSFGTNDQGQTLFDDPRYIYVNTNNESMYVSDSGKDSVVQIDMNGKVKREYKDDELKTPRNITVGAFGLMYLCDKNSGSIHLITPECIQVQIFTNEDDSQEVPYSVGYCDVSDKLYIGMQCDNEIKVYTVKHHCLYTLIRSHKNGN